MAIVATSWAYPDTVTGTGWAVSGAGTLASCVLTNNDGNYAYNDDPADSYLLCSDWLTAPATPLALPPGATPVGLELQVQGYNDGAAIITGTTQIAAQWGKDLVTFLGSPNVGDKSVPVIASAPNSAGLVTYGGPSELWGGGWTDVEAEAACLRLIGYGSSPLRGRYIDFIQMRWWYSEGTIIVPGGLSAMEHKYCPGFTTRETASGVRR